MESHFSNFLGLGLQFYEKGSLTDVFQGFFMKVFATTY